jgi:hypothetical protein
VNAKQGLLEKHSEGRYYVSHNGGWIDSGIDALEAQRKRKQRLALDEFKRLSGKASAQNSVILPDSTGRITLAAAAEKYFVNCEARPRPFASIGLRLTRLSRFYSRGFQHGGKILPLHDTSPTSANPRPGSDRTYRSGAPCRASERRQARRRKLHVDDVSREQIPTLVLAGAGGSVFPTGLRTTICCWRKSFCPGTRASPRTRNPTGNA